MLVISTVEAVSYTKTKAGVKVESKVIKELEQKPSAEVIVMLKSGNLAAIPPGLSKEEAFKQRKIKINENQKRVLSTLTDADFKARDRYSALNAFSGSLTKQGLNKLKNSPYVEFIHFNRETQLTLAESIPLIDADDVFRMQISNVNTTGRYETVCIIDTGVDYTHANLGGCSQAQFLAGNCQKVISGWDFCGEIGSCSTPPDDANPMDSVGHGTHVAGIVASTHAIYKGVAPDAKIVAIKVFNASGSGTFSEVAAGIDWCISNSTKFNISVISISLGDGGEYNNPAVDCDPYLEAYAINVAVGQGIFVSVASGNDAYTNGISYPACVTNATSVGAVYDANVGGIGWSSCTDATTAADKIICFTSRDEILDLLAPGALTYSTQWGGGFTTKGGTSMAAPHVSGLAALMQQYQKAAAGRALTPDEIRSILKKTGKSIFDSATGLAFPRINASAAVNILPNCTDSDKDKYNATGVLCGVLDCNDGNANIYPGAAELCNGVNDDCDGQTDEDGAAGCAAYYRDNDDDSYGQTADSQCKCSASSPYDTANNGDCNDANSSIYPGAAETPCDGIDQDCSGADSNGTDADSDSYRAEGGLCGTIDCNDANFSIYPGAAEKCNNVDDDCDSSTDETFSNESCQYVCANNSFAWTANGGNLNCCGNDAYEDSPYEAIETSCDEDDNDCDGLIDEGCYAAEIYNIPLATGWNLISTPFNVLNNSIKNVLSSIEGNYSKIFAYDTSNANPWKMYDPDNSSISTLSTITKKIGFWIKMNSTDELVINGSSANITLSLKKGINLIGYPSNNTQLVNETLKNVNFTNILAYENSSWKSYSPTKLPIFNTITNMTPGYGYWVKVSSDANWTFNGTFN